MTQRLVIAGTGLGGYTLARELRKLDRERPLTLVTADDGAFYSKPMLSNALAQGRTPAALATADAGAMAGQLDAEVRAHTTVTGIDIARRTLHLSDADLNYGRLVLALGADPIRLPLAGDAADSVMSVNDLADYRAFRARLAGARRVVVLGGGLIGCEFADDLTAAGYAVTVVDLAPQALGRLAPPAVGAALQAALTRRGVAWHAGRSVARVDHDGAALAVTLDDGAVLAADVVLSAVGLRPRTALAASAGLAVERGIVTDRHLTTSDPAVSALGDCAEVAGLVLPFVMPIMHAARALARTLSGTPTELRYPAMPVVVKTPALPVVIAPPAPGAEGEWVVETRDDGVRARFVGPGDTLLGFALAGAATAEKQTLTKELPPVLA